MSIIRRNFLFLPIAERIAMKSLIIALLIILSGITANARNFEVKGPQGGLSMTITLPDGFDKDNDSCPMVILMHGIFASKNIVPMPALAKRLADKGIASIRFDFGGHWKSEGKMQKMTIGKEIEDALAMWKYARSLPYVDNIGLLGHSQGGVVASMTAGILSSRGEAPAGLVLLAPGSVVQDACRNGRFFGARFDPSDPPEFVRCFGIMKLGREYIMTTQDLDIYGTAKAYTGPVRIIHGDKDGIVPMSCSERYAETYGETSELVVVEGENHMITKRLKKTVSHAVAFFEGIFKTETKTN